jgi:hypothetical protein
MKSSNDPRLALWFGQLPAAALRVIVAAQNRFFAWQYTELPTATLDSRQLELYKLGMLWTGYGKRSTHGRCTEAFADLVGDLLRARKVTLSDGDVARHLRNLNSCYHAKVDAFFEGFADDPTRLQANRAALRTFFLADTYTGWMLDMVLAELPAPEVEICAGTQFHHSDGRRECDLGLDCRGDDVLHPTSLQCEFGPCERHLTEFPLAG